MFPFTYTVLSECKLKLPFYKSINVEYLSGFKR